MCVCVLPDVGRGDERVAGGVPCAWPLPRDKEPPREEGDGPGGDGPALGLPRQHQQDTHHTALCLRLPPLLQAAAGTTTPGSQVAERLGNQARNQKVAGLIPDVVSLGKALHRTCLGGMSKLLWIRASAK